MTSTRVKSQVKASKLYIFRDDVELSDLTIVGQFRVWTCIINKPCENIRYICIVVVVSVLQGRRGAAAQVCDRSRDDYSFDCHSGDYLIFSSALVKKKYIKSELRTKQK